MALDSVHQGVQFSSGEDSSTLSERTPKGFESRGKKAHVRIIFLSLKSYDPMKIRWSAEHQRQKIQQYEMADRIAKTTVPENHGYSLIKEILTLWSNCTGPRTVAGPPMWGLSCQQISFGPENLWRRVRFCQLYHRMGSAWETYLLKYPIRPRSSIPIRHRRCHCDKTWKTASDFWMRLWLSGVEIGRD